MTNWPIRSEVVLAHGRVQIHVGLLVLAKISFSPGQELKRSTILQRLRAKTKAEMSMLFPLLVGDFPF
jgi:hypothetical protein